MAAAERYVGKLYGTLVMAALSLREKEFPTATVWLVGSALHKVERPRDVDVRVVLPDDDFERRFGFGFDEWCGQRLEWPRSPEFEAYMDLRDRVERFFVYACGERMMDVSVIPERIFALHQDDPKERLAP